MTTTGDGSSSSPSQQSWQQTFTCAEPATSKGKPKIRDDLELSTTDFLEKPVRLHQLAPTYADVTDTWRQLSMDESVDLLMVTQFIRTFKVELLGFDERLDITPARLEEALYSPNSSFPYLTSLYVHLHRLIDPTIVVDAPSSLARLSTFLLTVDPKLAAVFATTEFGNLFPTHHLAALKHLIQFITLTPAVKAYIDEANDRMAELRKVRWKRAGERRQLEGALPELQRQVAECRLKKDALGPGRTRGQQSEVNSLLADAEEQLRETRERLVTLKQEEELRKTEYAALASAKRSGEPKMLGRDRFGRKYWWIDLMGGNEMQHEEDGEDSEDDESSSDEEQDDALEEMDALDKAGDVQKDSGRDSEHMDEDELSEKYGILIEDTQYDFIPESVDVEQECRRRQKGKGKSSDNEASSTLNPATSTGEPLPQIPLKPFASTTYSYVSRLGDLMALHRALNATGIRERELRQALEATLQERGVALGGTKKVKRKRVTLRASSMMDKQKVDSAFGEFGKWCAARGVAKSVEDGNGGWEEMCKREIARRVGVEERQVEGKTFEEIKVVVKDWAAAADVEAARLEKVDAAATWSALYVLCLEYEEEIKRKAEEASYQKKGQNGFGKDKPAKGSHGEDERSSREALHREAEPMEIVEVRTRSGRLSSRKITVSQENTSESEHDEGQNEVTEVRTRSGRLSSRKVAVVAENGEDEDEEDDAQATRYGSLLWIAKKGTRVATTTAGKRRSGRLEGKAAMRYDEGVGEDEEASDGDDGESGRDDSADENVRGIGKQGSEGNEASKRRRLMPKGATRRDNAG
ncbi:hypothetical protein HDV00_002590 [Rhizophlyctis rosea]|nr:hypothetical protein HDV00_002590 [Rhizophlyctis rosea]